ncbi:hypothetical protein BH24CHL4_BH24CHL4_17670 [soil metagenome]
MLGYVGPELVAPGLIGAVFTHWREGSTSPGTWALIAISLMVIRLIPTSWNGLKIEHLHLHQIEIDQLNLVRRKKLDPYVTWLLDEIE